MWLILPFFFALILIVFRRLGSVIVLVGSIFAAILAFLAWYVPIDESIVVGLWSLKISPTLFVLGRRFVFEDGDRAVLTLIYMVTAIWFFGAFVAKPGNIFVPLGLGVVALLTAVLAVETFLFAAIFIELAVLLSVPMLVPPGMAAGRGVLRYVALQTLGMPFILFTGWIIAGVDTSPIELDIVVQAAVLMGFGFALLLAVFPFHSWVPMVAEEAHPYVAAFLFLILAGIISLFGLGFLNRYAWLRSSMSVYAMMRAVGFLMVVTGGVWAAFQRHLTRMLGYAVIVEIGLSILAIGLRGEDSLAIFFAMVMPRSLGFIVWALALSIIHRHHGNLHFRNLQGIGRRIPVVAGGLILAQFSIAGFPLFAGFPVRLALWEHLAFQYPVSAVGSLLGSIGVLIGGLHTMAVLVVESETAHERNNEGNQIQETSFEQLSIGLSGVVLLLVGVLPHIFLPMLNRLPLAFDYLIR